jgi:23S rRNA (cytosine1962-C5)-methyltransferase
MMKARGLVEAKLRRGEEDRLVAGHPWIYDNEIDAFRDGHGGAWRDASDFAIESGTEVLVLDSKARPLGRGLVSARSKIRIRMVAGPGEAISEGLVARRVEEAVLRRARRHDIEEESLRLVFAEADLLPGIIVDQYIDHGGAAPKRYLAVQFLFAGIEPMRDAAIEALARLLSPEAIIEKDDSSVRSLEGLPRVEGPIRGELPREIVIHENGIPIGLSLAEGQKTGYFLDQRENRALVARHAAGRRALDAFCHTGGFALHCLEAGAASVVAVDSSEEAINRARENAAMAGAGARFEGLIANAFDFLRALDRSDERFGLIILDPPAFAKSRAAMDSAYRGYKEINLRAMRALEPGGILASFSCSHHVGRAAFMGMLADAAADSGRRVRVVRELGQPDDHPILLGYDESAYLKGAILEAD